MSGLSHASAVGWGDTTGACGYRTTSARSNGASAVDGSATRGKRDRAHGTV